MTLTWFEKLPNTDAYRVGGHFAPYAVLARPVRFSDAELAAEYHKQDAKCRKEQWVESVRFEDYGDSDRELQAKLYDQLNTLHRFATQPHFDEEN
jgi:hypothetical protein